MNILVTGGASGLGAEITIQLAKNNENFVYFTYFKSEQKAFELEKKYSNVKAVFCDFNTEKSIDDLLNHIDEFNLQVLINNALTFINKSHFHKIESKNFTQSFQSNVLPFIKISQKAVEVFRKAKFGKFITILSSAIINKPPIGWAEYVAEKNYIFSICKSIATENSNFNITSNCVSPSFMLTELNKDTDERIIEDMKTKHPLKKILTIEETTEAIIFLVNATQHINGANIVINAASDLV